MLVNSSIRGTYVLFDWKVNQDVTIRHLRYYPGRGHKDYLLLPGREGKYRRDWIHDVILSDHLREQILRICRGRWCAAPAADQTSVSPNRWKLHKELKVFQLLLQLADAKDPLVGSPRELSEMCRKVLAADLPSEDIQSSLRSQNLPPRSRRREADGQSEPIYELPATDLRNTVEHLDADEADAAARDAAKAPIKVKRRSLEMVEPLPALEMAEPLPEGENHDANL